MVMAVCDAKERGGGIISEILCFPLFRRGIARGGNYGVRRRRYSPNKIWKKTKTPLGSISLYKDDFFAMIGESQTQSISRQVLVSYYTNSLSLSPLQTAYLLSRESEENPLFLFGLTTPFLFAYILFKKYPPQPFLSLFSIHDNEVISQSRKIEWTLSLAFRLFDLLIYFFKE